MKLYSYLDTLQTRALYIQPSDDAPLVATGDSLGDMTSELKPCEYISEYVSGGPKNYAYRTHNTETGAEATVCKVRGITLNYSASQLVNFEAMKQLILQGTETDTVTVHKSHKINRKRDDGRIRIVT